MVNVSVTSQKIAVLILRSHVTPFPFLWLQVEYYFSDENLPNDKYMLSVIKKNKDGFGECLVYLFTWSSYSMTYSVQNWNLHVFLSDLLSHSNV